MSPLSISGGTAHALPADLKSSLQKDKAALAAWEDITPLARNEWICWVEHPKKAETRAEHVSRACSELKEGKRRPCCWMGCVHRTDKPINSTQKWILEKQAKKGKR